jgi:hypothetical protein
VPIKLYTLTVKILLPGLTKQRKKTEKKKSHIFPYHQFSEPGFTKLDVFTDNLIPRRATAVFYVTEDFRKLVQSTLQFFKKTQQQSGDQAKHMSTDLNTSVW